MKRGLVTLGLAFWLAAQAASAGEAAVGPEARGDRIEDRLDRRGDRIDGRLDRRGDRVDRRLDQRGHRVDRRLDARALRREARG